MSDPGERCPESKRVDGPFHSWCFDGDDPYVVCAFCGERRHALSGRVIPEVAEPSDTP